MWLLAAKNLVQYIFSFFFVIKNDTENFPSPCDAENKGECEREVS